MWEDPPTMSTNWTWYLKRNLSSSTFPKTSSISRKQISSTASIMQNLIRRPVETLHQVLRVPQSHHLEVHRHAQAAVFSRRHGFERVRGRVPAQPHRRADQSLRVLQEDHREEASRVDQAARRQHEGSGDLREQAARRAAVCRHREVCTTDSRSERSCGRC